MIKDNILKEKLRKVEAYKIKNEHLKVENNKLELKNQIRERSLSQLVEPVGIRTSLLDVFNSLLVQENPNSNSNLENRIINELYPDPDTMTYEQLLELGEKIGTVSRGLDSKKIGEIKTILFSKENIGGSNLTQCCICFEEFELNEVIKVLKCKHFFHPNCIDAWLQKEKKCAMCKEEVI